MNKKKNEVGCEICGSTKSLIKHHITYMPKEEKITVCRSCHSKIHSNSSGFYSEFEPKYYCWNCGYRSNCKIHQTNKEKITKLDRGRITIPQEAREDILDDNGYAVISYERKDNKLSLELSPAEIKKKE